MAQTTSFTLNGKPVRVTADPGRMLVWVLRHNLGLTGTKVGCGAGLCGACTVLVDGEPAFSCSTALKDVAGKSVLTIEGLAQDGVLHPVQRAFQEHHAFQCGYCTSGMVMVSKALLAHNPNPSRDEVIEALGGNICRCTGYEPIIAAVEGAAQALASKEAVAR